MRTLSLVLVGGEERRAQVRRILSGRREIVLAGEVSDMCGLRLVAQIAPDIVVLDCAAPAINALAALPWLASMPGAPRVVALGAGGSPAERRLLLELGAVAYAAPGRPEALLGALDLTRDLSALAGMRQAGALRLAPR